MWRSSSLPKNSVRSCQLPRLGCRRSPSQGGSTASAGEVPDEQAVIPVAAGIQASGTAGSGHASAEERPPSLILG